MNSQNRTKIMIGVILINNKKKTLKGEQDRKMKK